MLDKNVLIYLVLRYSGVRFNIPLRSLIKLTRPPYLLFLGLACVLFTITFQRGLGNLTLMGAAVLAVVLISSGGAAINDYFDEGSDALTHPERPLPSGEITSARVAQFAAVLFVVGLGVALLINPLAFAILALNAALFILYPRVVKRVSGFASNLLMGYLGASVVLFTGAAVFEAINMAALSCVGMMAAAAIAFNVLKDVLTLEGDIKIGYTTLAARCGVRAAAIVGSVFILLTVITAPLPYVAGALNVAYLVPVAAAACIALYIVLSLVKRPDVQNVRRQLSIFPLVWIALTIGALANILIWP